MRAARKARWPHSSPPRANAVMRPATARSGWTTPAWPGSSRKARSTFSGRSLPTAGWKCRTGTSRAWKGAGWLSERKAPGIRRSSSPRACKPRHCNASPSRNCARKRPEGGKPKRSRPRSWPSWTRGSRILRARWRPKSKAAPASSRGSAREATRDTECLRPSRAWHGLPPMTWTRPSWTWPTHGPGHGA